MKTVVTELYELPRYGGSNYTVTVQFSFTNNGVIETIKTWSGGYGSGNEDIITHRISSAAYNSIARKLSNRIKITAGGYYGASSAYYKVNEGGQLVLLEPAPTMNLQGNGAANLFEDVYVDYMHDLRTSLVNSYRHNAERCGCHLCGFDIEIQSVPDLPIISE